MMNYPSQYDEDDDSDLDPEEIEREREIDMYLDEDTGGKFEPHLERPRLDNRTKTHYSCHFSASPPVLHFAGLVAGQVQTLTLNIINRSATSQRLLIVPPSTGFFKIAYEKRGLLAPGMPQKIIVTFQPEEFKYYYDAIKIRSEEENLLIPIHGYPIVNKIDFPSHLSFGTTPLCEPVTRKIRLRCSIPINFAFTLEITKPHPYLKIEPLSGVIPANGVIDISVTFHPFTLESAMALLLLRVAQDNFVPMECIVTARALSGKIESAALAEAEARLVDYLTSTGTSLNQALGPKSTFHGSLAPATTSLNRGLASTYGAVSLNGSTPIDDNARSLKIGQSPGLLQKSPKKSHFSDPTATVLSTTFRVGDINSALDNVIHDSRLLKQKEKRGVKHVASGDGASTEEPARLIGPGSGAAFDAGSQWIDIAHQKASKKRKDKVKKLGDTNATGLSGGLIPDVTEDRIIDGYRIPPVLNTTTAVNFVLTQERGKLKPKDLKAAIEKNRAEREARAIEQKKMREGTVGGAVGVLDLRAILGEERLNLEAGGPFKRQLRELTFLTEVDEVNKQEIEKGFRISEEFIGTNILTPDEIDLVKKQRKDALLHKKRSDWRNTIASQHSILYLPVDPIVKAGSSAETANAVVSALTPSFDTNTNDVWGKRMNTLRRFVSLVSRWLVRNRVTDRMRTFKSALDAAGVTSWEQGRQFIAEENATYRSKPVQTRSKSRAGTAKGSLAAIDGTLAVPAEAGPALTVASMVCGFPNPIQEKKLATDLVLVTERFVPSKEIFRRQLFPRFIPDDSSTLLPLPAVPVNDLTIFDDRTLYQLKVKPEFVAMEYEAFKLPPVPLSLPPAKNEKVRVGAPEECAVRPPADSGMSSGAVLDLAPVDPAPLSSVRIIAVENLTLLPDPRHPEIPVPAPTIDECTIAMPDWMAVEPDWEAKELDFISVKPDLRVYLPEPNRIETDVDWTLRPLAQGAWLTYDADNSLRSQWAQLPGFSSVNRYLLGAYESRNKDPPPLPGPTLSDYYLIDLDRHRSGLCCMDKDHKRTLTQHDPEIKPLAMKQDKHDVLTDSESDDEDGYRMEPPTIEKVRAALRAVIVEVAPVVEDPKAKGGKGAKGGKAAAAPAPAATPTAVVDAADDESNDIKEDQVELMRDRKTLEMESAQRKQRERNADAVRARLAELSKSSNCLLQAMPVQVPFHCYEQDVYNLIEARMPPVLTTYAMVGSPNGKLTSPMNLGTSFAFDK